MKTCTSCSSDNMVAVEYSWDHPEYYDGISEYHCLSCSQRVGRWTLKVLGDNEYEPKYGYPPKK